MDIAWKAYLEKANKPKGLKTEANQGNLKTHDK